VASLTLFIIKLNEKEKGWAQLGLPAAGRADFPVRDRW